jgi:hypothetical protein
MQAARAPPLRRLVEDDQEHDPLEAVEVVMRAGGHERGASPLERKLLVLDRQGAAPLEDEVELVPLVWLLLVGLGRSQDVDPDLEPVRLVDDLVAAGAETLGGVAEVEGMGHSAGRVDVAALAVARAGHRAEEELVDSPGDTHPTHAASGACVRLRQWISVSSLNMGRYIAMMMIPTMIPTPIIMSGSMIDVRVAMELSTSSS